MHHKTINTMFPVHYIVIHTINDTTYLNKYHTNKAIKVFIQLLVNCVYRAPKILMPCL